LKLKEVVVLKDYYKILEVNDTASPEVIQAAYKVLAKKYHPDCSSGGDKALKEARMKEINNAKETLLNPIEREKYDSLLRKEKQKYNQEVIEYKVEQHREKERAIKERESKRKEYKNDTIPGVVFGSFSGFFGLFKNTKKNAGIIVACAILFILAFLELYLCLNYFMGSNISAQSSKYLVPNSTTIKEVVEMFGKPKNETSSYLEYKDHAKILVNNKNIVIGWIDNYQELEFERYEKIPKKEDISIGMYKKDIIDKWGLPDTYSTNLLVYDRLIINFENDKVTKIEKQ
jgi:hypothetical protein